MPRAWIYLTILGLCASAVSPVDIPLPAELLPRLDQLAKDVPFALRLVDGEEITTARLVVVDTKMLSYDTGFRTIQVERLQIFKAVQNNTTFSDYPIRKSESQNYPRYESYIFERGDILIETSGKKNFGFITVVAPEQYVMRTDSGEISVPRDRVVSWRKSGISFGEPESKVHKQDAAPKTNPATENRSPIEITGFLAGPWLPFPQAGVGIGSDVRWPVFFGIRGTLGSMDTQIFALLKQVSIFANINFARTEEYAFFLGGSLLWRSGKLENTIQPGSSVLTTITQTRYSLHVGFRTARAFLEAGVELGISSERTYSEPAAQSITDASNIRLRAVEVQSSINRFDAMSQVHVVAGIFF